MTFVYFSWDTKVPSKQNTRQTKGILTQVLMDEMRESFRKSQEFLDYETNLEREEEISRQRIITSEEFEKLVTEGWQYLGTLPNGKIVVKNKQGSN